MRIASLLAGLLVVAPVVANAQERPEDQVCRESVGCVERGWCAWHDERQECVASHLDHCRGSTDCRRMDVARSIPRSFAAMPGEGNPGLFYTGLGLMAAGGATMLVGVMVALANVGRALSGRSDDTATTGALVAVVAGPILVVGVGLPMLLVGNAKSPARRMARPRT